MEETTVGIRELKAQLSAYLQQVKAGKSLVITEHGKPIGRLVPLPKTKTERIQAMMEMGLIKWNGQKLGLIDESKLVELEPGATKTVTDILLEDRR
jgi:prevent-host-death family protein